MKVLSSAASVLPFSFLEMRKVIKTINCIILDGLSKGLFNQRTNNYSNSTFSILSNSTEMFAFITKIAKYNDARNEVLLLLAMHVMNNGIIAVIFTKNLRIQKPTLDDNYCILHLWLYYSVIAFASISF